MEYTGIVELRERFVANGELILIVGFGLENQQFLEWLVNVVDFPLTNIAIADKKQSLNLENLNLKNHNLNSIKTYLGENYLDSLENISVKLVVKAPGMWSLDPKIDKFREKHGNNSVISSLYFFVNQFRGNIIGVTGTKGKSTTCSLLKHLLNSQSFKDEYLKGEKADFKAHYCGNTTNISPYQFWTNLKTEFDRNTLFIMEMSSFQLQDLGYCKISPKYSIVTNYYSDHLDQHANLEEYLSAKNNIFNYQLETDFCFLNEQITTKIDISPKSQTYLINSEIVSQINEGIFLPIVGEHNRFNLALGLCLYSILIQGENGLKTEQVVEFINKRAKKISGELESFVGLAHRIELFESFEATKNGCNLKFNFYDDGAATEANATNEACKSLTAKKDEFLWLIVTGKDKKTYKVSLVKTVSALDQNNRLYRLTAGGEVGRHLLTAIYGSDNLNKIKEILPRQMDFKNDLVEEFYDYLSIDAIVDELGGENGVVTSATLNICLSPSGSSFDEFANYTERSKWFKDLVKEMLNKY